MSDKIADNLKKLRKKKGYSLEKVARLADLSLNNIVRIENGINKNPTIKTLIFNQNRQGLEVDIADLIVKYGFIKYSFNYLNIKLCEYLL